MGLWGTIGGALGSLGGPLGTAAGGWIGGKLDGSGGGDSGGGGSMGGDLRDNQRVSNDYQLGGYGAGQGVLGADGGAYNPYTDPTAAGARVVSHGSGADDMANRYQGLGAQWANMQAPGTDYSAGNRYMGMSDQARGNQAETYGMYRDAALGNGPSVAALQQQRGMQDAMASQLALQAGARGASGLAQAGYNAAGNTAALQRGGAMDASMLRAQEIANARAGMGGMANSMRQGDYQGAGMMDQRTQYGANLAMQQRQLGQQGQLGFEGMGYNTRMGQLGANQNYENLLFGQYNNQQNINQRSRANDTANVNATANMIGTIGSLAKKGPSGGQGGGGQ